MFGTRDVALSPALATAFIETSDAKTFLGVSGSDYDDTIEAMVLAASQAIEAWCGGIFTQRTVTETMFPEDSLGNLVLSHSPIISLTSVTIDDVTETLGDYRLMKQLGALRRVDGGAIAGNTIVAVYAAGYATIPDDVQQATREFVRDLFNSRDRESHIASEMVPDVGSITYRATHDSVPGPGGTRIPGSAAALLGAYVRSVGV